MLRCWSLWHWRKATNSLSQMNCCLTHSCFPDFCRSPILSLSLPQFSLLHPLSEGCSHPHSQNISETINSLIRTTHSYLLSQPTRSRAAFTFLRISRSIFPSAIQRGYMQSRRVWQSSFCKRLILRTSAHLWKQKEAKGTRVPHFFHTPIYRHTVLTLTSFLNTFTFFRGIVETLKSPLSVKFESSTWEARRSVFFFWACEIVCWGMVAFNQ